MTPFTATRTPAFVGGSVFGFLVGVLCTVALVFALYDKTPGAQLAPECPDAHNHHKRDP